MDQPLRPRRIGLALLAAAVAVLIGGSVGWRLGQRQDASPVTAVAAPIPGVSPSVPVFVPYSKDITYPALATHLRYRTQQIGQKPYRWKYSVPQGWISETIGANELRWRPADEPSAGGYFLRVKLVSSHMTPQEMVQQKFAALKLCCQDVTLIRRDWNTIGVTYRDDGANILRWDIFRWLTPDGGTAAEFEMSVSGRRVDEPGLQDMLTQVSASARRIG